MLDHISLFAWLLAALGQETDLPRYDAPRGLHIGVASAAPSLSTPRRQYTEARRALADLSLLVLTLGVRDCRLGRRGVDAESLRAQPVDARRAAYAQSMAQAKSPIATATRSGMPSMVKAAFDRQRGQNRKIARIPSLPARDHSPMPVILTATSGQRAYAAKALPERFWHSRE